MRSKDFFKEENINFGLTNYLVGKRECEMITKNEINRITTTEYIAKSMGL